MVEENLKSDAPSEEETAFQQTMESLDDSWRTQGQIGGRYVPSPLEEKKPQGELSSPPPSSEAPETFLGEWTADQVIEKLSSLDVAEERLLNRLMGHLGPVGRKIKALEEALASSSKDVTFDVEAFAPLKSLDEGIYDAIVKGMEKGFKVQDTSDRIRPFIEEKVKGAQEAFELSLRDAVETRLLETIMPNYLEISGSPGFTDWILKNQPAEIVQAFRDWDSAEGVGKKNAGALLSGYRAFSSWRSESDAQKKSREDALKRSAVSGKSQGAVPRQKPTSAMTEDEAFEARMKEIEAQGLRL